MIKFDADYLRRSFNYAFSSFYNTEGMTKRVETVAFKKCEKLQMDWSAFIFLLVGRDLKLLRRAQMSLQRAK